MDTCGHNNYKCGGPQDNIMYSEEFNGYRYVRCKYENCGVKCPKTFAGLCAKHGKELYSS